MGSCLYHAERHIYTESSSETHGQGQLVGSGRGESLL